MLHTNKSAGILRYAKRCLEELKSCEKIYRNSVPDITHNHFKLLFSKKLWLTILNSSRIGWRTRNLTDEKSNLKLKNSKALLVLFI